MPEDRFAAEKESSNRFVLERLPMLREKAEKDDRSLSQYINLILKKYLEANTNNP